MKNETRSYWFNFKTEEYEYIETPNDFHDYISQEPSAQSLYDLYIEHMGKSPLQAALEVLKISAGVKE